MAESATRSSRDEQPDSEPSGPSGRASQKRAIIVGVAVVAVLLGGGATWWALGSRNPTFGRDDQAIQVEVGQTFTIALEANPSVGDQWSVTANSDRGVVSEIGDGFEGDDPDSDGGGGTKHLHFHALSTGTSTIEIYNCFQCAGGAGADADHEETLVFEVTVVAG